MQRLRRQEGLQVSKKQRPMKRVAIEQVQRQRAQRPRQIWSWDFVSDQTENGRCFRILTVLDEYTRQCLATHVAWSIRAVDVIRVVETTMKRYGMPDYIRSDNGPEFIAYELQDWLQAKAVKTLYIKPGSPWENGHIESFHDKLRDEHLNREIYGNLLEAKVLVKQWTIDYNQHRPHSSLGYRTPAEFAASCQTTLRALPCASSDSSKNNMNQVAKL